MRTVVVTNRPSFEEYKFDDTNFVYGEDDVSEQPARFSGYSTEPESAYIKSLREKLFHNH